MQDTYTHSVNANAISMVQKQSPVDLHVYNLRYDNSSTCQILCIRHTCALPNVPMFYSIPFSVWQEIVLHARQTCEQQTNTLFQTKLLSATITPIDISCMLLVNL